MATAEKETAPQLNPAGYASGEAQPAKTPAPFARLGSTRTMRPTLRFESHAEEMDSKLDLRNATTATLRMETGAIAIEPASKAAGSEPVEALLRKTREPIAHQDGTRIARAILKPA